MAKARKQPRKRQPRSARSATLPTETVPVQTLSDSNGHAKTSRSVMASGVFEIEIQGGKKDGTIYTFDATDVMCAAADAEVEFGFDKLEKGEQPSNKVFRKFLRRLAVEFVADELMDYCTSSIAIEVYYTAQTICGELKKNTNFFPMLRAGTESTHTN